MTSLTPKLFDLVAQELAAARGNPERTCEIAYALAAPLAVTLAHASKACGVEMDIEVIRKNLSNLVLQATQVGGR